MSFNEMYGDVFLDAYLFCRKKEYEVDLFIEPIGTTVYNNLEDVFYIVDENQVVLSGTVGEEWVTNKRDVMRKYVHLDGSPIREEDFSEIRNNYFGVARIKTKVDETAPMLICMQLPLEVQCNVETAWGDVLKLNRPGISHGMGDWVVATDTSLADKWVVNGEIFENTYDLYNRG